jgi:hypothetical protein
LSTWAKRRSTSRTIRAICQYQLIAVFVFGVISYELLKLAQWIITE